ncbi:MAG: Cytochrome c-type biosis protein CcmH [Sphingomonas bacterium]|nr:Cytochrome c-type biosis protein CcmH [Sphingomonas bacterium]
MTEPNSRSTPERMAEDSAPRIGRIALIAAALIAAIAIGVAIWRARTIDAPPPPAPTTAAATAAGDVTSAITQLEARLRANPNDAQGWRMLGWSYYRTERFADAVAAYRKATVADPANAEGWSALGEAVALAGKGEIPAEAAAAFRKALAIDPKDARARYFLAVGKDLSGDHKGAITDWIALLKDTPAGAPWEENVRRTIALVAEKNKIDVAGRVPAPTAPTAPAASVATDAIPGPTREQMAAASSIPPSQQDAMVRGMVEGLAARLKSNPKDGDGWIRLMRARLVLGEQQAATQAYRDATAAFAGNKAEQARLTEAAGALGVPGI